MAYELNSDEEKTLNNLSREEIVSALEGYGFACYESESTSELRSALRENIEDGTIEPSSIL